MASLLLAFPKQWLQAKSVWGKGEVQTQAKLCNKANSTKIVSWHQDLTYWGLDDAEETTCWVVLSDVSVASGAMKFVAGSHKQNIVDHVDTFSDDNLLSRGQEIAVDVNEEDAVAGELKPGQAYLHHGHLFHASGPNSTTERPLHNSGFRQIYAFGILLQSNCGCPDGAVFTRSDGSNWD